MAYPQTANSGSYQAVQVPPTPISPMQEARTSLTNGVNLLHERIGDLGRRLESVLRPATPTGDRNDNCKAETAPSEHRQFLAITTSEIHSLVERLDDILRRIEL